MSSVLVTKSTGRYGNKQCKPAGRLGSDGRNIAWFHMRSKRRFGMCMTVTNYKCIYLSDLR